MLENARKNLKYVSIPPFPIEHHSDFITEGKETKGA